MAFKSVSPKDISSRRFKAYKSWQFSDTDDVVSANEARNINVKALTDVTTEEVNTSGINKGILFHWLKQLFYPDNASSGSLNKLGKVHNDYDVRSLSSGIGSGSNVIFIPNRYVGEEIKPGSLTILDNTFGAATGTLFEDDGYGNLIDNSDVYGIKLYDADTGDMTLVNGLNQDVALVVSASDFDSGSVTFLGPPVTTHTLVFVDFENGIIKFLDGDVPAGLSGSSFYVGNIFYQHGTVTLTNQAYVDQGYFMSTGSNGFTVNFKSTSTITENEVFISVKEDEFNRSINPTSHVSNSILDDFLSYEYSSSVDTTGSFLAPYITTIGLYDDNYDLVAVAKLARPVKSLPEFPVNFLVRFDS